MTHIFSRRTPFTNHLWPMVALITSVALLGGCSATAQDLGDNQPGSDAGVSETETASGGYTVDPNNLSLCQQACLTFGPESCTRRCIQACKPIDQGMVTDTRFADAVAVAHPVRMACAGSTNVTFYDSADEHSISAAATLSSFDSQYKGVLPDGGWNTGKRVFATSRTFLASEIKTAGGKTNGLKSADQLCQTEADASTMGGTWAAWLSSPGVNASDHIVGDGPWYVGQRSAITFRNRASWQVGPTFAIGSGAITRVWTGTGANGKFKKPVNLSPDATGDCGGWSQSPPSGPGTYKALVGTMAAVGALTWTDDNSATCDDSARLYCFEQ